MLKAKQLFQTTSQEMVVLRLTEETDLEEGQKYNSLQNLDQLIYLFLVSYTCQKQELILPLTNNFHLFNFISSSSQINGDNVKQGVHLQQL